MEKRRQFISVLAGVLALVLVLGLMGSFLPTTAQAITSGELRAQLNALKAQKSQVDEQLEALDISISQNNDNIEWMVEEKYLLDQEINLLYMQINNINSQISTYNMLIADKQAELSAAEKRFAELLADNKERIQAMEEEGSVTYWSVLFQANSFADFLDRINMIQEIAASDRRRLNELNKAAELVSQTKEELEAEKVGLEASQTELAETQDMMEGKREEADAILVNLVARGMEYEELVRLSEQARAELMVAIANTQSVYNAVLYQEWLATSVPSEGTPLPPSQSGSTGGTTTGGTTSGNISNTTGGSGEGWLLPVDYTVYTSPFGDRDAPTAGASTDHKGVDLAAPAGTPIYATQSGTVSMATSNQWSGNYVKIDHADEYSSVYMHMTNYVVAPGQYVTQGQIIGYVGSTGVSTGNHLHFGISQNGTYVNPADYVTIK